MGSGLNEVGATKLIQAACKRISGLGDSAPDSSISLLETAYSNGKDEVFFRTLLQNILDNQGCTTLREFTYDKEVHGSSIDFLDLEFIERCDLLIRRPKDSGFDKDALAYIELKAQAYGDFKEDGKLAWNKASIFWNDVFNKLNQYKFHHKTTDCFFGIIAFGIDKAKNDGALQTYPNVADATKRENFVAFCESQSDSMGMSFLFSERILPREGSSRAWLSLDFALFSVDYTTIEEQDEIISRLFPNSVKNFAEIRNRYQLSLFDYQLRNFPVT